MTINDCFEVSLIPFQPLLVAIDLPFLLGRKRRIGMLGRKRRIEMSS